MTHARSAATLVLSILLTCELVVAAEPSGDRSFLKAKTIFQTNVSYDPRIALAVDGIIVHQHGAAREHLGQSIMSWKQKGYSVGRMFFADSDATNAYWKGQWDGSPHPDEVERTREGEPVLCSGIRPYMLPTPGWTKYLGEMTRLSLEVGADAILPEEPLAHIHTGYEKAFAPMWEKRYASPWEPEHASPLARFRTGQLKSELYLQLERDLSAVAKSKSDVPFIVPIHSLYSNLASGLVAPLGTSCGTSGFDGYIGQIWTGPVNWALANYGSPDKSFFSSAYVLYDYFTQLTVGTDRRLWLLIDPVEDDPNHKWAEFEEWYRHCVVASLMFPGVSSFEVMPWPDRIFLPGYGTGGSTPAPEGFRISILSAVQVQQEVPYEGTWTPTPAQHTQIGVAVADTILWENDQSPCLQGMYGMLMPLAQAGVPVASFVAERAAEPAYMARFKAIVLSYEPWKPMDERFNAQLAAWVRAGGCLVLLGAPEGIDGDTWWKRAGFASPLQHLASKLGLKDLQNGDHAVGKGTVLRRTASPSAFADPAVASRDYLPLIDSALHKAGVADGLHTSDGFCMRRGPFVAAHAIKSPQKLDGTFVDVFDPQLPVRRGVTLPARTSGLYKDVRELIAREEPAVLHTTHRLMSQQAGSDQLTFVVRGPAETPAVARVFCGSKKPASITATQAGGKAVAVETLAEQETLRLRFPNVPEGVTVEITWGKP